VEDVLITPGVVPEGKFVGQVEVPGALQRKPLSVNWIAGIGELLTLSWS